MNFFKSSKNRKSKQTPTRQKREERKEFSYFMQLFDNETRELVGHLADISSGGFKMDSRHPISANTDIQFRMELTSEVADKPYMVFIARSKWCKADPFDPLSYNVGFHLIHITPGDREIFIRMMEQYGAKREQKVFDPRRTNMW
jgi:hypothetical protein